LAYSIRWHEKVLKDLKALDRKNAGDIVKRVKAYLVKDPVSLGKPLKGIFHGLYRYRYGDYRVINAVNQPEREILILRIGHRKDVYR